MDVLPSSHVFVHLLEPPLPAHERRACGSFGGGGGGTPFDVIIVIRDSFESEVSTMAHEGRSLDWDSVVCVSDFRQLVLNELL